MKTYQLTRTQTLPISLDQAWEFFSDPRNLAVITPPWLGFKIVSDLAPRIYPGMIITYTVRPALRVPVTWVTEITHVKEPFMFVDEQRVGPYALWHHQHHFKEIPSGIEATDIVTYALPFGFLGRLIHPILVKPKLHEIFAFRRDLLEKRFGRSRAA